MAFLRKGLGDTEGFAFVVEPGAFVHRGFGIKRRPIPNQPRPSSFSPANLTLIHLLEDYYERYQVPIIVTETSAFGAHKLRSRWLDASVAAIKNLRGRSVPVLGYTWFPLITMVDWAYRTSALPVAEHLLHLGLWDSHFDARGVLVREPTPLVERYRGYIQGEATKYSI